jgi:hypothetical protein
MTQASETKVVKLDPATAVGMNPRDFSKLPILQQVKFGLAAIANIAVSRSNSRPAINPRNQTTSQ